MRMSRRDLLAATAALLASRTASAQSFPDHQLRLVLPYSPGGVVDTVGRVIAQGLTATLGQSVVAENRSGAGGVVGADYVAKAAPDGYVQLLIDPALIINPSLQQSVPYDVFRDFQPISIVTTSPLVLVVAPSVPANTVAEFIALVRANKGRFSYASAGVGTTPHLAGEMFSLRSGADATHVPYRGIAAGFADMMTGQVQFSFSSIAGARGLVADGKLKALATTGARRSAAFPDLPTMTEAGMDGFIVDLWLALLAPAGTPMPIVDRVNEAVNAVLGKPETIASLARLGVEPRGTTVAEATAVLRSEFEAWRKLIADARITL